jgi:hypothetical protein
LDRILLCLYLSWLFALLVMADTGARLARLARLGMGVAVGL